MYELGERLARNLNHKANLDVDGFEVGGIYYIIDLNCRFGGLYPYSHLAGANFPKAIVHMLMKKKVPDKLLKTAFGILATKDIIPVIVK